ncbi:MAG: DUF2341 domain-containing protein, partial [Chitinispirillaceae bacterium]|nr:DUF2341 domain-containing protein [Chitinispirillaceae bacterium]
MINVIALFNKRFFYFEYEYFQIQIVTVLLFGSASLSLSDDYKNWNYSQTFFQNTTISGANVSANVYHFPLLVRLNPGNFSCFSQTLASGADIRFTKTDGTHLPYQIERWVDHTGNNDTAEIWVLIDTVYGNTCSPSFVMYWGNPDAVDSSDGAMVFRAKNGFLGTYHLGGNLNNTTGSGHNGTDSNSVDTSAGIIGRARAFNGSSQYFHVGDLPDRPRGTISCWFRPKTNFTSLATTSQGIWGKKESDSVNATLTLRGADFLLGNGSTGAIQTKIENFISSSSSSAYLSGVANSFSAGTWYHVSWTWGNNFDAIYINGVADSSDTGIKIITGSANDEIGRSYYDVGNIESGGPLYFKGTLDEFRFDSTIRPSAWIRLCYQNQKFNQSLVQVPGDYTWDRSTTSGIQTGSGNWGIDNYWTSTSSDGSLLSPWQGAGNSARFAGADGPTGTFVITIRGTQYVDSITFNNNGYILSGGTAVNFGTKKGIYVASGKNATIRTPITGSGGITKTGGGMLYITGACTYTGNTTISNGAFSIGSGGRSGSVSGNIVNDDTLYFNQSDTYTFRGDISGAGRLIKYGSGTLILTGTNTYSGETFNSYGSLQIGNGGNTGSISGDITNNRSLNFNRSDSMTYSGVISGSGAVTKNGTGTLILTGTNTYNGATTVSAGSLIVNGSTDTGSAVTIASGAILGGTGICGGPVTVNGGTISPGTSAPGTFFTGTITLNSAAALDFDLGTQSDAIAVSGDLTLGGTINIVPT